ncbi:MAG: hypothetical protein IIB00_00380 [candidate division Zixibacteria bacterium]|nr:hypothetical protein [candidate division Zixibacteria bacterium]
MTVKIQRAFSVCVLLIFSAALNSCGNGYKSVLPEEVRTSASTWYLTSKYEFLGESAAPSPSPHFQAEMKLARRVEKALEQKLRLSKSNTPDADITITIQARQMRGGSSGSSRRMKRQRVFLIEFFDNTGRRIGEFYERNQSYTYIGGKNGQRLADRLADDIAAILEP